MAGTTPDEEILVSSIQKGKEEIRVRIMTYKTRHLLDIRKFFENENGTMLPTAKGISVPATSEFVNELIEALQKAQELL